MTQPVDREKIRSFHRRVLLVSAVVLASGALAGIYVAFFARSSDLPSFVYALGRLGRSKVRAQAESSDRFEPPPGPELVSWGSWGRECLERARATDRLILLDLSASWCRPCALMDRQTYRDPAAADWIKANVVPVRVDTDERPELTVRYLTGGWPTTALLLPTGEVLSSGTFIPPEAFLRWARQVAQGFRQGRSEIEEQRVRVRREAEEGHRLRLRSATPSREVLDRGVENLRWDLTRRFDPEDGGFGTGAKFPASDPVRFLTALQSVSPHPEVERMLRATLDGELRLLDPVWGGAFRYSTTSDWRNPSTEKLLSVQADLLKDFVEAYALTGEASYRRAAESLEAYLRRFLSDPDGGFYASQAADLVRPDGSRLPGAAYYALSEPRRLALGVPEADKRRPADGNAKAALGLLAAARTFSDPDALALAERTLDRLWETASPSGELPHLAPPEGPRGLAEDEVLAAQAMLEAYSQTGRTRYLGRARRLWSWCRDRLFEKGRPPLMEGPAAPEGLDRSLSPYATELAAELAQSLADLTLDPGDEREARRLFDWCAAQSDLLDPTVMGRLAIRAKAAPVVVFVAGKEPQRGALARAFGSIASPRKYLVGPEARSFWKARRGLPKRGGLWAVVCVGAECRPPREEGPGLLNEGR